MGCDIHITVGRVNQRLLPDSKDASEGTALALFNNRRIRFGDFEFDSDIPEEMEINRSYQLFAFLASIRGSIKPLIDTQSLMLATSEFMTWLNKEYHAIEGDTCRDPYYGQRSDLIGDYGAHDVGEHSQVFYPIEVLRQFDYDQVALIEDEHSDFSDPLYFPDKEGHTYRDHFTHSYFMFLDWCHQNNWQFVIFGFDS